MQGIPKKKQLAVFCISVGKQDMQLRLDHALLDVKDKYLLLEETEKSSVRTALIEERGRFCLFVSCLKPVVVSCKGWVARWWCFVHELFF